MLDVRNRLDYKTAQKSFSFNVGDVCYNIGDDDIIWLILKRNGMIQKYQSFLKVKLIMHRQNSSYQSGMKYSRSIPEYISVTTVQI